jgi:hypothetical protein
MTALIRVRHSAYLLQSVCVLRTIKSFKRLLRRALQSTSVNCLNSGFRVEQYASDAILYVNFVTKFALSVFI